MELLTKYLSKLYKNSKQPFVKIYREIKQIIIPFKILL